MVEQQPKNYIADAILEAADGDPRVAFGMNALNELVAEQQVATETARNKKPAIQVQQDVWLLMDDI